ncbi:MAG: hypothetical protein ACRDTM_01755 [Micromonosporaceae bacterium]
MSLPYLDELLTGLVLWNPVLDLRRSFVEPELPWGLENFNLTQQERLGRDGFLLIDGEFALGRVLWEELLPSRGAIPQEQCSCAGGSRRPRLVVSAHEIPQV